MKRIAEIAEGLSILAKHDSDGFSVCFEHDIVYAGPTMEDLTFDEEDEFTGSLAPISADEATRLTTLGWHIDRDVSRWAKFC